MLLLPVVHALGNALHLPKREWVGLAATGPRGCSIGTLLRQEARLPRVQDTVRRLGAVGRAGDVPSLKRGVRRGRSMAKGELTKEANTHHVFLLFGRKRRSRSEDPLPRTLLSRDESARVTANTESECAYWRGVRQRWNGADHYSLTHFLQSWRSLHHHARDSDRRWHLLQRAFASSPVQLV
jgi:hypothetical protein